MAFVKTEVQGAVEIITIDRPKALNALNPEVLADLKAAFEAYDMEYPGYRFYCTCRASRKLLGDKLPNHQLQTVAAYCGYDLTKHHHAMADAEACAAIAIKLIDF